MNETDPKPSVQRQAQEAFVEALLEHQELPLSIDRRIRQVEQRLDAEERRGQWMRRLAGPLSIAAVLAVAALLSYPTSVTAGERVRRARAAETAAGDRRYSLVIEAPVRSPDRPPLQGWLDVRDSQQMLLRVTLPDGRCVLMGRDGDSAWQSDPDGVPVQRDPNSAWASWMELRSGGLLIDSMERLLSAVDGPYRLEAHDDAGSGSIPGAIRIQATRTGRGDLLPDAVQLWIDPSTEAVMRAELRWDDSAMTDEGARPAAPPGRRVPPGIPAHQPSRLVMERTAGVKFESDRFSAERWFGADCND